jgi:hypothetical protein
MLLNLLQQLVTHPMTSVEAALIAGAVRAKVWLLAAHDTEAFVRDFEERVIGLSKSDDTQFELVRGFAFFEENCFVIFFFECRKMCLELCKHNCTSMC